MPLIPPKSRHIVEKSTSSILITLPTKKNIFQILWTSLYLFLWGYMTTAILYGVVFFQKAIASGEFSVSSIGTGTIVLGIVFLFFGLFHLSLGVFGIYRLLWLLTGKEVIEAHSTLLKVTKQTLLGKSSKEYSANEVKDVRVAAQPSLFMPFNRIQKLLGVSNVHGMIAFDYGAKTFRFGLEIDEAEAKQIILSIEEGFRLSKAG